MVVWVGAVEYGGSSGVIEVVVVVTATISL